MSDKLKAIVARCVSGELAPTSKQTTELLWNVLCDPDDWSPAMFKPLAALAALAPAGRTARGLVKFERPTVVFGDLVVNGDIECNSHTLVLGDVRCTGYLYSGIHTCVIVAGDLEARALEALRSYWMIGGSIESETTWLSTYGFLRQRGEVRTRLLVLEMYFELLNKRGIRAKTRIETDYLPKDAAARARLSEVIDVDGLLDAEGVFDTWALLRKVARGKPVFRGARRAKRTKKPAPKKRKR